MTAMPLPPGRLARAFAAIRSHALVIGVAAAACAVSVALIPGSREHALMDLEAGRIAQSIQALERAVRQGDHSAWTLSTLGRAREASGNPTGALSDLERLAAAKPDDVAILSALAEAYRSDGRLDPLARVLGRLQALAPSAERQRILVRTEEELGRTGAQREALSVLVERFGASADEHLALARLEAAEGRPADAAAALAAFEIRHPQAVTVATVAWNMSLRIVAGRADQALERGRMWLEAGAREDAPRLAEVFMQRRLPGSAVALLEPFVGAGAKPELVAALALAEFEAGDRPGAKRRFKAFEALLGPDEPRDLRLTHLRLALGLGEAASAVAAAEELGIEALPPDLVPALAFAAMRADRLDLARALREVDEEAFTLVDPLVAAEIDLGLGEWAQARKLVRAAAAEAGGDPARILNVAGLQMRIGDRAEALSTLRGLPTFDVVETASVGAPIAGRNDAQDALPRSLLRDAAHIFIGAGAAAEGEAMLRSLRRAQPSPEADYAWSLAALASGRVEPVRAWLSAREETPFGPDALRDLALASFRAKAYGLAADLAARLVRARGTDDDRLILAEARVAAGRPWMSPSILPAAAGPASRFSLRTDNGPTLR